MSEANPFEVLRLDPSAKEEEIVRQAGLLRQRTVDEAESMAISRAVQELTSDASKGRLFALLTHAGPSHASPLLDRFAGTYRRPPASAETVPPCPSLDRDEITRLLCAALAEEMEQKPPQFEPVPSPILPAEIQRQLAEAVLQSLLCDPRG